MPGELTKNGSSFGLLCPVKQRVLPHLEVCAWSKTPKGIVFFCPWIALLSQLAARLFQRCSVIRHMQVDVSGPEQELLLCIPQIHV